MWYKKLNSFLCGLVYTIGGAVQRPRDTRWWLKGRFPVTGRGRCAAAGALTTLVRNKWPSRQAVITST